MKTDPNHVMRQALSWAIVVLLLVGCGVSPTSPAVPAPTSTLAPAANLPTATPPSQPRADGLSEQDVATLASLKKVDDYPLYTMRYQGPLDLRGTLETMEGLAGAKLPSTWACSLFAALGDPQHMLYGRNFDWEYSPALLLFAAPPDGYASVSMVDIAYLGFGGQQASSVTDLPLTERRALLSAPFLPFDGMNEHGLTVGMAAVPPGDMNPDPNKESIDSLRIIRKVLDQAGNVDEAVAMMQRYNISMEGGPPLHYLMADRTGRAALVEFYRGKMIVIPNDKAWHQATNFLRSSVGGDGSRAEGQCWRYDTLFRRLTDVEGRLSTQGAMSLLADVSQNNTQWSVVYDMITGEVMVTMGRRASGGDPRTFRLDLSK